MLIRKKSIVIPGNLIKLMTILLVSEFKYLLSSLHRRNYSGPKEGDILIRTHIIPEKQGEALPGSTEGP